MPTEMRPEMRKTGVDVVGDMPWGTHFCLFYETRADLLETLVSYWQGWIGKPGVLPVGGCRTSHGGRRRHALERAVPDLDRYREALVEALCFGWIDGVRKSINKTTYKQRFTPRKSKSYWGAVNMRRVGELAKLG